MMAIGASYAPSYKAKRSVARVSQSISEVKKTALVQF